LELLPPIELLFLFGRLHCAAIERFELSAHVSSHQWAWVRASGSVWAGASAFSGEDTSKQVAGWITNSSSKGYLFIHNQIVFDTQMADKLSNLWQYHLHVDR